MNETRTSLKDMLKEIVAWHTDYYNIKELGVAEDFQEQVKMIALESSREQTEVMASREDERENLLKNLEETTQISIKDAEARSTKATTQSEDGKQNSIAELESFKKQAMEYAEGWKKIMDAFIDEQRAERFTEIDNQRHAKTQRLFASEIQHIRQWRESLRDATFKAVDAFSRPGKSFTFEVTEMNGQVRWSISESTTTQDADTIMANNESSAPPGEDKCKVVSTDSA